MRSFLEEVRCVLMKGSAPSGSTTDSLSVEILYKGRGKENEGTVGVGRECFE